MNPLHVARRQFLGQSLALTIGAPALNELLSTEATASASTASGGDAGLAALPHFPPRARHVIYLMQSGGPSHVDLFDDKTTLRRMQGEQMPQSILQNLRQTTMTAGQKSKPCMAAKWPGSHRGETGMWISDLLPYTAQIADDLCFVRSVHGEQINHAPAMTHILTGHNLPGRPSMGAWLHYGLGALTHELPSFVVMTSQDRQASCGQLFYDYYWGSGFLPGKHQGVPFRGAGDPVLFLSNPSGVSRDARRAMLDRLGEMNHFASERVGDPEIETRISQYEMAFRMQASVPELTDFSTEPQSVLDMYGPDVHRKGSYAYNCLMARRLVEAGRHGSSSSCTPVGTNTATCPPNCRSSARIPTQPSAALVTRPQVSAAAGRHAGDLGRRVRPHALRTRRHQQPDGPRPRPSSASLHHLDGRRWLEAWAPFTAAATSSASTLPKTQSTYATCKPPSCTCAASTMSDSPTATKASTSASRASSRRR